MVGPANRGNAKVSKPRGQAQSDGREVDLGELLFFGGIFGR